MMRSIVGSILHGGTIELFLVPASRERDVALWQERPLMVRWVVGSILHGGPIELFLVSTSRERDVAPW